MLKGRDFVSLVSLNQRGIYDCQVLMLAYIYNTRA